MFTDAMRFPSKDRVVSFVWQHVLLAVSLFIMTLGVALSVRSNLGSSVISTIPFVMSQAGGIGMVPQLTIGEYTYLMNIVLVALQIAVLRRRFEPVQLFQLLIGFMFGWLLDVNMFLTAWMVPDTILGQVVMQFLGCTVLAFGISMEIKCGSVTMPGEGFPAALCKTTEIAFGRAKIMVDISLVVMAVCLGYIFFGRWMTDVVGFGTLFAMIYVGAMVRRVEPLMRWFDSVLCYRPGLRRYYYGLSRFLHERHFR